MLQVPTTWVTPNQGGYEFLHRLRARVRRPVQRRLARRRRRPCGLPVLRQRWRRAVDRRAAADVPHPQRPPVAWLARILQDIGRLAESAGRSDHDGIPRSGTRSARAAQLRRALQRSRPAGCMGPETPAAGTGALRVRFRPGGTDRSQQPSGRRRTGPAVAEVPGGGDRDIAHGDPADLWLAAEPEGRQPIYSAAHLSALLAMMHLPSRLGGDSAVVQRPDTRTPRDAHAGLFSRKGQML